jgi:hypothetical protein
LLFALGAQSQLLPIGSHPQLGRRLAFQSAALHEPFLSFEGIVLAWFLRAQRCGRGERRHKHSFPESTHVEVATPREELRLEVSVAGF